MSRFPRIPPPQSVHLHRPSRRMGLGIVELLISLMICAMLLTSVAIAFHASAESIDANQKMAQVTQNARVVLHRMMTEARKAASLEVPNATTLRIIPPIDGSGVTLVEYIYDPDAGTLRYARTKGGTRTVYDLLTPDDGVTISSFALGKDYGVDANGLTCVKYVTARLDMRVDNAPFAVTATTYPRRNMIW